MIDWKKLNDAAFEKLVDKLSSSDYKKLIQSEEAFADRVNGFPWKEKTYGIRKPITTKMINKDSDLGKFIQAEEDERTRPERELEAEITDMVEKDLAAKKLKLRTRLDSGQGLDAQLCTWCDLPKNIPVMANPVAGFSGNGLAAVKAAWSAFAEKYEKDGKFNEAEKDVLINTMSDACGIVGKSFDMRSEVSWEAVYMICLMAGRISSTRTKPVEEKPKVNLERAEPTPADLRRAYFNDVVILWKGKGCTANDIDRMGSEEYKQLVGQTGYDGGKIARNMNQILTHVGGSR